MRANSIRRPLSRIEGVCITTYVSWVVYYGGRELDTHFESPKNFGFKNYFILFFSE